MSQIVTCRVVGIDPGSRATGYGVIEMVGHDLRYVDSGVLRIRGERLPDRLHTIFLGVSEVLDRCQPTVLAIENLFMHRNADSALKLGQARGAAICSAVNRDLEIFEYTPAEIKQAVVGRGNAAKEQVQMMVRALLKRNAPPQADEADALACAICHAHRAAGLAAIGGGVQGRSGGRWR